jgi:hypothetical protein
VLKQGGKIVQEGLARFPGRKQLAADLALVEKQMGE